MIQNLEPAWLNLKVASSYSGLSIPILRRLVNDPNGLPHIRLGGRIIIAVDILNDFLREQLQTGPADRGRCLVPAPTLRVVEKFIQECCTLVPGRITSSADLFVAFRDWGGGTDPEPHGLLARRKFGMALRELGFGRTRGAGGRRCWLGLRLYGHLAPPIASPNK